MSKLIIVNAMIPLFKTGDFQGGIERGTDDIISVLSTDASEWKKRPDLQVRQADDSGGIGWLAIVLFIAFVIFIIYLQRKSGRRGGMIFVPPIGGSSSWGSSSGGGTSGGSSSGDSGGFSGGGGSSGGGGASGEW